MSTFLYDAIAPPDPRLTGEGEAEAGTFTVCPVSTDPCTLAGISLSQLRLSLPYVVGLRRLRGSSRRPRERPTAASSVIDLLAGVPVGAACSLLGLLGHLRRRQGRRLGRQRQRDRAARPRPGRAGQRLSGGHQPGRRRPHRHPRVRGAPRPRPPAGRAGPARRPVPPTSATTTCLPYFTANAQRPGQPLRRARGRLPGRPPPRGRCCRCRPAVWSIAPRSPSTGTTAAAPRNLTSTARPSTTRP